MASGTEKKPKKSTATSTERSTERSAKRSGTERSRGGKRRRPAKKKGTPTRNILFFVVLVVVCVVGFGVFGNVTGGGGASAPKWKTGDVKTVQVTLVPTDYKDLNCAMSGDMGGKKCAFEAANKRQASVNGDAVANKDLLQPFSTTNQIQFLAAGLWATPPLKKKIEKQDWKNPDPRFNASCKVKVLGKAKNALSQWKPGQGWNSANGWYVVDVQSCTIGAAKK